MEMSNHKDQSKLEVTVPAVQSDVVITETLVSKSELSKSGCFYRFYFSEWHIQTSDRIAAWNCNAFVNFLFYFPSVFFMVPVYIFAVGPTFIFLCWRISTGMLIFYITYFLVSFLYVVIVKKLLGYPRIEISMLGDKNPYFRKQQIGSASFPSGDTTQAVTHGVMLVVMFPIHWTIGLILPILVGWSRLFTGCHRIYDVLFAYAVTLFQYFLLYWIFYYCFSINVYSW